MRPIAMLGMIVGSGWGCPAPADDAGGGSDGDADADTDTDTDTAVTCFPDGTRSREEICATGCTSAADCGEAEDCWLVNGCPGGSKGVCGTSVEACRAEGCAGPCCFHIGADPGKVTSCESAAVCCS
jgi:hypothetical protein